MTSYPLPSLAAQITSTGVSAPSYADINLSLQASMQQIYGSDIVLTSDSQDGQLVGIVAKAISDANQSVIDAYNSFSPATAQGAGLSSNVKINGLARLVASNSSANVTIVGQAGTIISGGIVQDANGNNWSLPATVTIPIGGSIVVTATAQQAGAISAPASTITQIVTPTRGWQTVNNAADAVIGAPVENDATLRMRQSVSTGLPAQSVLEAIVGAIENLSGVQAVAPYENDTGTTDSNGLPAHSISLVVQGGDATQIAQTISFKKTPGTATYGTTSEVVTDQNGVPSTINFYVPTQVEIDVNITIKSLAGYVSTTGVAIQTAIAAYISSLGIGGADGYIFNSKLYLPANHTGSLANTYNITALTARRGSNSFATTDIPIAFNELPTCVVANVTLTVT